MNPRGEPPSVSRSLFRLIGADLRRKALWCYESDRPVALLKVLLTDGTPAMILYRLMQWSRRWRLAPLEILFNKLNAVCCNCIIGRGAEFGPGLVLIHSTGVVINGRVRGGSNVLIEHQVTIGAERRQNPVIGDDVFLGAGAKVLGPVSIGDGARIGANAVVVDDIPPHCTVVGIPARVVRRRPPPSPAGSPAGAGAAPVLLEDGYHPVD
ncbi:MAG: serine acetyltransferase [Planctomycetaceae bacterium]|nr:serine acetyltransferase [Planctomycetaceae bacterium]